MPPEIAESVSEAVERAHEGGKLNARVAVIVALTATIMALCNVKGGNVGQAMSLDQAKAVDAWSYYQAKGTKLNLAEATLDQLELQRAMLPATAQGEARALLDRKLAQYQAAVQRYTKEKDAIKAEAEGFEADYERLGVRDDQLDLAEALLSIGIALFGITALTQQRRLFLLAVIFAGVGASFGVAAFLGLDLRVPFLARLLA